MKLKASEIVLILAAIGILALLGYNLLQSGEETVENEAKPAAKSVQVDNSKIKTAEELKNYNALVEEFNLPPDELREVMKTAPREKVLRYMRLHIDRDLPADYEFPEFLLTAGSSKESVKRIGERYPEFYMKGGRDLVEAVRQYPVKYGDMIQESRAYRQLYRPTSEVEAEEQAKAAHRMREELKKKREAEKEESK